MTMTLLIRNRNYRLLFAAGTLSNLGDGLTLLALPWLASQLTADPLAIAAVAAAARMPWLLFALPAGVIIDRADRRKLIARADMARAGIVLSIMSLALAEPLPGSAWLLVVLAFLLGSAEVLRDNAAQTILPTIVDPVDLEKANGQMWSAEQLTGQFIGPPLAGLLIGAGIALPFGFDAALLAAVAGFVWLITIPARKTATSPFLPALIEGLTWMRGDGPLLRLALILGFVNFLYMMATTFTVLLSREILGLSAASHGMLLSVAASGAVVGSLGAQAVIVRIGAQASLFVSLAVWALAYALIGLSSEAWQVAASLFSLMAASMLWNVITVSWRQRRIPPHLLGRVNSIYRFFGWGSMPLGALAGGAIVSLVEHPSGREMALRTPFLAAAIGSLALLVYAAFRLRLR